MKPNPNPFLRAERISSGLTRCAALSLRMAVAAGTLGFAHAADTWTGTTDQDWNTASNWGGAFPTGNATINTATGNFPIISANSAFTPVDILVGVGLAGRVDHRAGTVSTGNGNWMVIGRNASGSGTYNLADTSASGGTLTGFGAGSGSVTVGGTSTTGGRLILGDGASSLGTFNMNTTGSLTMEEDAIGMLLGNGGTSVGNFKLDGGTVTINSLTTTGIGILAGTNGGDANFRMSGGTVNVVGGVWAGDNNIGSQGLVDITGGTFTATATGNNATNQAGQHFIGRGLGQGTFNVSSTANVTLSGTTHIGFSNTATTGTVGTLAVSGGTFQNTGEMRVGSGSIGNGLVATASGNFNVSGGTATVTGTLLFARGNDAGDTVTGTGVVSGGTLNAQGDVVLGYAGNANLGKLTVSGGALNVGTSGLKWLIVGQFDTSKGQLDVTSGSVGLQNNSALRFSTGNNTGVNVVNQSGGSITFYSDAGTTVGGTGLVDMQQGGGAATNNTYNLDGGTLTTPQIISNLTTGTRTFNLNGGTLKAAVSTAAFMNLGTGTARANVRNGGAKIDSNGFDVTIDQALLHSNIGGDLATDGGLVKSGSGKLTLTATSTYNGGTSVNGGTLIVNGNISTSILTTVASGGTLGGSGTVGALTALSGGTVAPGNSPGILTTGTLDLQSGSTLGIELNGTTAGTGYDRLDVTGTVSLAGVLSVTTGFTPVNGDLFFILLNDSNDAITGTFSGLADNSTFTVGGQDFRISYFGDSGTNSFTGGNDVALQAVPEPQTAALLGALGAVALLRRRRAN